MLQVATFLVPEQQDKANEFLRTHKPEQNGVNFNKDTVVIFYDNGETSPECDISELHEFLKGNRGAKFQQEVAMHVMTTQLADLQSEIRGLNRTHNKGRFEEAEGMIANLKVEILKLKQAIAFQDLKADFVKGRIAKLRNGNKEEQEK